jgi:lysozyme
MPQKITKVSEKCIHLIEYFECGGDVTKYLKAYKCPAGVWTIGIGTTYYPDGSKVKQGDTCTTEQAYAYLQYELASTEIKVDSFTTDLVTQQQFDSLVSFAYNVGTGNLKASTLLKKVNLKPADPEIEKEFNKWVYAKGVKLQGLVRRRKSEAWLYFHNELKFDF